MILNFSRRVELLGLGLVGTVVTTKGVLWSL